MPETVRLTTYGHEQIPETPWDDYPRPQFRRKSFICLNGYWNFSADVSGSSHFPGSFTDKVRVPYPVESALSGIEKHFPEGTSLWYSRVLPSISFAKDESVILHIDAVDQEADVFINKTFAAHICTFEGRDGIDITGHLSDSNVLTLCVKDDLFRKMFPYGKQTLKRGGMWYTPFSGIWQSAWIEVVPKERILSLKIHPSLTGAEVEIEGPEDGTVIFEGKEFQFREGKAYDILKDLDSSRIIDSASGWFSPEKSDVESLHVYFRKFRMPESSKPVLLSEFGGYSCKIEEHSFNLDKTYGYRFFNEREKYMDALEKLYVKEIIPAAKAGLSGAIYTQVSDVEDETNGLLTYDRAICKADRDRMLKISKQLATC